MREGPESLDSGVPNVAGTSRDTSADAMRLPVLTSEETRLVIGAYVRARGRREPVGVSADAAAAVVQWAESARIASTMLDLVLRGRLDVDMDADGEPRFFATERAS